MTTVAPSLLRLAGGDIALFYMVKNGLDDCRLYQRVSTDETATWSEPALCIPDEGYYCVHPDRVVQLMCGRLVIPASSPLERRFEFSGVGDLVKRVQQESMCYLSDDGGQTWRRSRLIAAPAASTVGIQEPAVVQLRDGRLWMLCRTNAGCLYESFSEDRGETWTAARPTALKAPLSPCSVERIPSTGDLLLVWNNHDNVAAVYQGKRSPFHAALSRDDGRSWEKIKLLGDIPENQYSYTCIAFVQDRVLLSHHAPGSIEQMTVFDVAWLYR